LPVCYSSIFISHSFVSRTPPRPSFNHPNDPNWKGPSSASPNASILSRIAPTKPKGKGPQTSEDTSSKRSKHSTPLVSQSDLFRLKVETESDTKSLWDDDPPRYRQRARQRSRSRSKGASVRRFDNRSYLGVQKPQDRTGRDRPVKAGSSRLVRWLSFV
jgi:hypothetical protein